MRKTKIIATAGPSFSSTEVLRKGIEKGVDVIRINFAHGSYEQYTEIIKFIKQEAHSTSVCLLGDIAGPKLRALLHPLRQEIELTKNGVVCVSCDMSFPDDKYIYINYRDIVNDVKIGDRILLDDGKIILKVVSKKGKDRLEAEVLQGGTVKNRKGINLPDSHIKLSPLTEKDLQDIDFAIENGVNWLALSFVQTKEDILQLKRYLGKNLEKVKIIAKIERPLALEYINEIIKEVDGIMIARGDLGVEIEMKRLPVIQRNLIDIARKYHKVSIVATQVMESMIDSLSPKRPEVTDVYTAVIEGADAIMLSNETSVGKHPIETISTLEEIIRETEKLNEIYYRTGGNLYFETISDRICYAAVEMARVSSAKAIITMTYTGRSAFIISSFRPLADIFAFTPNIHVIDALNMLWGVRAFFYDKFISTDHTIKDIKTFLLKNGYVSENDIVVNVASMPIHRAGPANMIKVSYVYED